MGNDEALHYKQLAETILFEKLSHKHVLATDADGRGCSIVVEHFHHELFPKVIHLRW